MLSIEYGRISRSAAAALGIDTSHGFIFETELSEIFSEKVPNFFRSAEYAAADCGVYVGEADPRVRMDDAVARTFLLPSYDQDQERFVGYDFKMMTPRT